MGFLKRLLGGGNPASPADPDAQVLAALVRAGADLRNQRSADHFLYFPTEEAARAAADQLATPGRTISVSRPAVGPQWLTQVTEVARVDATTIAEARREYSAVAASGGGEYDGWGAEVPEAADRTPS